MNLLRARMCTGRTTETEWILIILSIFVDFRLQSAEDHFVDQLVYQGTQSDTCELLCFASLTIAVKFCIFNKRLPSTSGQSASLLCSGIYDTFSSKFCTICWIILLFNRKLSLCIFLSLASPNSATILSSSSSYLVLSRLCFSCCNISSFSMFDSTWYFEKESCFFNKTINWSSIPFSSFLFWYEGLWCFRIS